MEKGRKWKKGRSGLREKNVIIDWEIIWICFLGKLWFVLELVIIKVSNCMSNCMESVLGYKFVKNGY